MIKFSTLAAKHLKTYVELPAANKTVEMFWDSIVMLVKGGIGIVLQVVSVIVWLLGFFLLPVVIPLRVLKERKDINKQVQRLIGEVKSETNKGALEQKLEILRRNVMRFDRNDQILLKNAAERGVELVEKRLQEL